MNDLRVVIADDDHLMASCVADMVRDCGFEPVAVVTTGGLDALRACQEQQVDVIITDVHMPDLNGINILHTLRARPPSECPMIIFISGAFADNDPLIQHAAPDAFLPKPIFTHSLMNVLDMCLKRKGKRHHHAPRQPTSGSAYHPQT